MPRHPPCALCTLTFWYSLLSVYSVILSALFFTSFDVIGCLTNHFWLSLLQCAVFKVHVFVIKFLSKLSGDNEIRTRDLLLARQALSQLSYTPIEIFPEMIPGNWTTTLRPVSQLSLGSLQKYEPAPQSILTFSIERRWSSRTFRYGYLVTT